MLPARPPHEAARVFGRHAAALTALVVALIVLGPLLVSRGFVLHYDAVFVPRLPFNAAVLGVDGNPPRAVPNDLVVAILSRIVPGDLVEKSLLVGAFVFVGAGIDRWRQPVRVGVIASVTALWNPWVAERLSIGHVSYLWGYGSLVWIVVGALRWRAAEPDGRRSLAIGLCVSAAAGSTPALLAVVAMLVLLLAPGPHRPSGRSWWPLGVLWLGLNAPWWWPGLTERSPLPADPDGVRAFASTSDSGGGLVVSVLGGGGIWHEPSWFGERASGPAPYVAAVLLVTGVAVLLRSHPQRVGLCALGVLGLLVACAASIPVVSGGVGWAVEHVPGSGLLRDGQKFLAWWVAPASLGVGLGTHRVAQQVRGSWLAPMALVVATALPVALLPSLAWAREGRWKSVQYPREFIEVSRVLDADGARVASMPWRLYRRYDWNDGQVTLDPFARLLSSEVLVNDTLTTSRYEVDGERRESEQIARAMTSPVRLNAQLRAMGVNFLVVDKTQPGADASALRIGRVLHDGRRLTVREISAPSPGVSMTRPWPWGLSIAVVSSVLAFLGAGARRLRAGRDALRVSRP